MLPFINAHTHRPEPNEALCLLNCLTNDEPPQQGLFSIGMHPWYLTEENAEGQFRHLKNSSQHPSCLAIGECGLDRLRGPSMDCQLEWLNQQAKLANILQKPLIIHCVRAFDVLLQWLKQGPCQTACMIHGFQKKPELMQQLLAFDCFFSFGWKGLQQSSSIKSFEILPANRFLLETDDAEQSIEDVYTIAAKLRGLDIKALKQLQIDNFQRIFNYEIS